MSNTYTLAEARAIIDAEKCVRFVGDEGDRWCLSHERYWPLCFEQCSGRPEVADVAAQLLATVERVEALADHWRNVEMPEAPVADEVLTAVLNGEG